MGVLPIMDSPNIDTNYVQWCMDSLRWDSFVHADAPNMKNHAKYKRAYSRAGFTAPSLFSTFMNVSWYQSKKENPIPWMKPWVWLPRDLKKEGYYTVFVSANPMMELYQWKFKEFDEYVNLKGCIYHAHDIVEHVKRIYEEVEKPKYIFLLLMETHQPYLYLKRHTKEYITALRRPITRQIKAIEAIDRDFGNMRRYLEGTNTDILVFSDHGDLDLQLEGEQGHGPALFHPKLFEIPLGRATV